MFSANKALDTILKNWRLPETQQWIGSMDPQSQLELHNALSQHIMDQGLMPASNMAASPMSASNDAASKFLA